MWDGLEFGLELGWIGMELSEKQAGISAGQWCFRW